MKKHSGIERAFADAVAIHRDGRLSEAASAYRRILATTPDHGPSLFHLGMILYRRGDWEAAIDMYRHAIRSSPSLPGVHVMLGLALEERGRLPEAEHAYRERLAIEPGDIDALNSLGLIQQTRGRLDESLATLRRITRWEPDTAAAWFNLGRVHKARGELAKAESAYRRALSLQPDDAEAWNNLGNVFTDQQRVAESIAAYERAIELQPDFAGAHHNLGNALHGAARVSEAIAAYRHALALAPQLSETHSNLLFCLHYTEAVDAAELFREHQLWASRHTVSIERMSPRHEDSPDPDRRLRLAYLSADFRSHPVGHFVEPIIEGHDRNAFEVLCYSNVVAADATTERLRTLADIWCDIRQLTDDEVVTRIGDDRVDILVDLAGHTGDNRIRIFAAQPAPVQVSYLGYPDTTGLSTIDYRLVDARTDPVGSNDHLSSEELIRLPDGFLCYRPPVDCPAVAGPPISSVEHVTLGSFNNAAKLSSATIRIWAEILRALPNARLLLKARQLGDEDARRRFLALFEQEGVAADRVALSGWALSTTDHLGTYGRVDIALDPFPYNGTTTTCEALWMGVPVITLTGEKHCGRVGFSLLSGIGLSELIAETPEHYVELAVELATDAERLGRYRRELRDRMTHCPLTDEQRFMRSLESAYRTMWRRWCE